MKRAIALVTVFLLAACAHVSLPADDQLFDEIDANHDGSLTIEELERQNLVVETEEDGTQEVHQAEADDDPKSTSTMTFEQKRKLLKELDQNRDGSISRPEWNRASDEGFVLWNF